MEKSDYSLWRAYHNGIKTDKLTEQEIREIRACEFAMHLLIPTNSVLEICGGLDNLEIMYIYHNYLVVKNLAKMFKVEEDLMLIKLEYLLKEKKKNEKRNIKSKVIKKEGKRIFVNFN